MASLTVICSSLKPVMSINDRRGVAKGDRGLFIKGLEHGAPDRRATAA